MNNSQTRSDRFERIARCDESTVARLANEILDADPPLEIRQEPKPQLLMQQVREPVERRPFNLGEVLVTPAEVELDGERGFAMHPGKSERAALSGAIVDAAIAGGHERAEEMTAALRAAVERREAKRTRQYSESQHTEIAFETMEDER